MLPRLSLLSGPAREPLQLSEVKLRQEVADDRYDGMLTTLIAVARRRAEECTGRALIRQEWEQGHAAPLARELVLSRWPVIEVLEVRDDRGVVPPTQWRADVGDHAALHLLAGSWQGSVRVRTANGYGATGDDVPADLREWMHLQIGSMFLNREAEIAGSIVSGFSFADEIIEPYRIVRYV